MKTSVLTRAQGQAVREVGSTRRHLLAARTGASSMLITVVALGGCAVGPDEVTYFAQSTATVTSVETPIALSVTERVKPAPKFLVSDSGGEFTMPADPAQGTWIITPATGASVVDNQFIATQPGRYEIRWKPNPPSDPDAVDFPEQATLEPTFITVNAEPTPAETPTPPATTAPAADRSAEAIAAVKARTVTCFNSIAETIPNGEAWRQSAMSNLEQVTFSAAPVPGTSAAYTVTGTGTKESVFTVDLDSGTITFVNPSPSDACLSYFD